MVEEVLLVAAEAFLAGIFWSWGSALADFFLDRLFPYEGEDTGGETPAPASHKRKKRSKASPFIVLPLVLATSSCGGACVVAPSIPYTGPMSYTVPGYTAQVACYLPDCSNWRPSHMTQAFDTWRIEIADRMDLEAKFPLAVIIEDAGDLGPAGPEVLHTQGKAMSAQEIRIAGRFFYGLESIRPMGNSALGHELMHVLLWQVFGDPDGNHETPPGRWTAETQDILDEYDASLLKLFPEQW